MYFQCDLTASFTAEEASSHPDAAVQVPHPSSPDGLCADGPVLSARRRSPAINPVVMNMSVDSERQKDVTGTQPDQDASSSLSARRMVSAAIGFRPRETTNPLRAALWAAGRAIISVLPVSEHRRRRFTAVLIVHSPSRANDFARAYISVSRFTVNLIPPFWWSGGMESSGHAALCSHRRKRPPESLSHIEFRYAAFDRTRSI